MMPSVIIVIPLAAAKVLSSDRLKVFDKKYMLVKDDEKMIRPMMLRPAVNEKLFRAVLIFWDRLPLFLLLKTELMIFWSASGANCLVLKLYAFLIDLSNRFRKRSSGLVFILPP